MTSFWADDDNIAIAVAIASPSCHAVDQCQGKKPSPAVPPNFAKSLLIQQHLSHIFLQKVPHVLTDLLQAKQVMATDVVGGERHGRLKREHLLGDERAPSAFAPSGH